MVRASFWLHLQLTWWLRRWRICQPVQETHVWSLGWEDLEKGMATHSSIIAWKIPWTEEPGRLQSMESQRVGHDWATALHLALLSTHRKKQGSRCFISTSVNIRCPHTGQPAMLLTCKSSSRETSITIPHSDLQFVPMCCPSCPPSHLSSLSPESLQVPKE